MDELMPGFSSVPNVHPLFVHFPITLWTVAFGFWAFGLFRNRIDIFGVGRWLLYLGTLGALMAVATGLWAEQELGHDSPGHEFVHLHRNYMLVALALGAATTVAAFLLRMRASRGTLSLLTLGLAATVATTTLGADRGAALVYGHGVGVSRDMPEMPGDGHQDEGEHPSSHGQQMPPSAEQVIPTERTPDGPRGEENLAPGAPSRDVAEPPSTATPLPAPPPPKPSTATLKSRPPPSRLVEPEPTRAAPSTQPSQPAPSAPMTGDHGGHSQ